MSKRRREVDWYYTEINPIVPKSTTRDMQETGLREITKTKIVARKQLNFQSYPMNDFRFDLMTYDRPKEIALTSSYSRDYAPPNDEYICQPKTVIDDDPDPLFNRKPPSEFGMRQTARYKFMDDQFINLSESRKRINFMRQLRTLSDVKTWNYKQKFYPCYTNYCMSLEQLHYAAAKI